MDKMLQAIAIDDEPMALEVIRGFTEKVIFVEVQAYFTNPLEAFRFLQERPVDLIFLDIKMPDLSGLQFLRTLSSPPMVIFTTAYGEHAVEGFELDAIDFLLKPFALSRFLKACNKAYEQHALRQNGSSRPHGPLNVFIKSGYDYISVDLKQVRYVESYGNYVVFVLPGQKIASRLSMQEAENLLPELLFIRIHRSYLVGRQFIEKVERKSVWVQGMELPIGSAYTDAINKIIK